MSSISGHSPLMKPEAAVPRLTRAIVLADAVGAGFVNTDEMVKPDWMDDAHAHEVMRYSLEKAALVAARHGVYVCIEPHGIYTQTSEGLLRIVDLVPSAWIQVNWDTGNAYIAGAEDPYEGLERAGCTCLPRPRQGHFLRAERRPGQGTGTPVGCACGEGVVDWERVLHILDRLDREITLSVECGTIDQAERAGSSSRPSSGTGLNGWRS